MNQVLLVAIALLSACAADPPPPAGPPPQARGAIVVLIDALRADHLGVYGYDRPTTPVLDALAAQGVLFRNARTVAPWTLASTASLMTGLLPTTHGAGIPGRYRDEGGEHEVARLDHDLVTIAEVAAAAGFQTALFARNGYLGFGVGTGFETVKNPRKADAATQVDRALRWIGRLDADDRFLLFVHVMDVHTPSRSAPELRPLFPPLGTFTEAEYEDHRTFRKSKRSTEEHPSSSIARYRQGRIATYDAALRTVDREIGRLIDGLDPALRAETLMVVTADHGEELWDHVALEASVLPRNVKHMGEGHGHTFFDELLRIPLIMAQPGRLSPSVVSSAVANIDIAPTLLDALELPPLAGADGRSLWAAAKTGATLPAQPLLLDEVCFGYQKRALITNNWKYIWSVEEAPLLFDLSADPGERHDLSRERPEQLTQMQTQLSALVEQQQRKGRALRGDEELALPMTPEEIESLKGLGYLDEE